MLGEPLPPLSKVSRVKEAMANMFATRLKDPTAVFSDFVKSSIQGMVDIMKQRLNQGLLGDMSRQAKLAASCIQYKECGIFDIRASSQTIRTVNTILESETTDLRYPLGGNPCVRAISAICGVAQQAALDSHRASQGTSQNTVSTFDLIQNFIQGGSTSLVVLRRGTEIPNAWNYKSDEATYCLTHNNLVRSKAASVIGSYSSEVLRAVKLLKKDIREVCAVGISVVCKYYGVILTNIEFWSLVELMCYRCEAVNEPITIKRGIMFRNMRWMICVFASHYGRLQTLQKEGKTDRNLPPETITDAFALCNFDYIKSL